MGVSVFTHARLCKCVCVCVSISEYADERAFERAS